MHARLLRCLPIGLLDGIHFAPLTHQQTKNTDIHLPISDRLRGQRGANVWSGWGEKSRCNCGRLPSLCIWCTQLLHRQTEPDEYINTNKQGEKTRPARNWTGVAAPANIRMRVNVRLISTGSLNCVWTKICAFWLPHETYQATQPGLSEAHYKQSSGVFKTRTRSINRYISMPARTTPLYSRPSQQFATTARRQISRSTIIGVPTSWETEKSQHGSTDIKLRKKDT